MGYRTYIGYLPKEDYNKIKDLTKGEILAHFNRSPDDWVGPYDICKELYEFGKYTNFQPPDGSMIPFFTNKELQEFYSVDDEIWVVNKDFLKYIIDSQRDRIRGYLRDMVSPFLDENGWKGDFFKSVETKYGLKNDTYDFDGSILTPNQKTSIINIINHIISINSEWSYDHILPYKLDDGKDEITSSWKYEYSIFELVRIYKTFDWENNVMVHYGY